MNSLANARDKADVIARLRALRCDNPRQWGKMSAHQMVCHLSDSFRAAMGDMPVNLTGNLLHRTVLKWVALYAPLPWPPGVNTPPEVDQELGGTGPVDFPRDVSALLLRIERFTQPGREFEWQAHPYFGALSDREWLRWGYLHTDHHLRQFGA